MPDWSGPVFRYILEVGLPTTLRISAFAVVGSAIIGVVLGTVLTIRFWPSATAIRGYIEVFRGLPILVTVFVVYFGLPSLNPILEFGPVPRRRVAPSGRSRTSSTRRRPRSASAGSAGTRT